MHNVNEIIVSHGIGEGGKVQKFIDNAFSSYPFACCEAEN